MRMLVGSGLVLWLGVTLLLSTRRWFARQAIGDRLRLYSPGGLYRDAGRSGVLSVETFRDVVGPLSAGVGGQLSRIFGVSEELAVRLRRIHSPVDAIGYRIRQFGWVLASFGLAALITVGIGLTPALGLLLVLGAPLLAFLILEQSVAAASKRWQRRLFLELPVVSEQLGMLLSAGYSLGGALNRVASRSGGACGQDLRRVQGRVRQGLSDVDALREWSELAKVDAVDRLVRVLALNREATDLGKLIAEEARAIRRDVQRELVERIEGRGQQVWIPVTVATLLPGVIFLSVPFVDALRLFAGG